MAMRRHLTSILLPFVAAMGLANSHVRAENPGPSADPTAAVKPKALAGILENPQICESSGLARSGTNPRILWTHNDSGDSPRLFAIDDTGHSRQEVLVRGAKAVDWEDITSFVLNGKSYLAIADTGNNQLRRKECHIYVMLEPQLASRHADVVAVIPFRYADAPHDCESLAYDPQSRQFLLAAKTFKFRTQVFTLAWPLPGQEATSKIEDDVVARPLGTVPIPFVTSMDISRDGNSLVLLSLFHSFEYTRQANADWPQAFLGAPRITTLPDRRQGEAICYSHDGRFLFLTSEHVPTPLLKVPAKSP